MSTLLVDIADNVATVTLNRPQQMNAMSAALRADLTRTIAELNDNPNVKVAVLTGAGERAFSAGLDLKELGAGASIGATVEDPNDPVSVLNRFTKPIIGAINGVAITAVSSWRSRAMCCWPRPTRGSRTRMRAWASCRAGAVAETIAYDRHFACQGALVHRQFPRCQHGFGMGPGEPCGIAGRITATGAETGSRYGADRSGVPATVQTPDRRWVCAAVRRRDGGGTRAVIAAHQAVTPASIEARRALVQARARTQ